MKEETPIFKTTCCYCGVGCGILVEKDVRGRIMVSGDPSHPVNQGLLCSKGMNLHYTVMDQSDRILYPGFRTSRESEIRRSTWDEALEHIATVFQNIRKRDGPDAIGFYISGQCLTEEYSVANKLVKGFLGTNNLDTNSRLCMSSAVSGYKMSLGEDAVPISYEDIEVADCFLIAGANPAWCHPIIFRRIEDHKAKNPDVKIIVVDPRKTQTAAMADLHLQIKPGTDIVLFNAIARGLIENDFINREFIEEHTNGFEFLVETVMKRTLQEAASLCGIKFTDIYRAVKYIGSSSGFLSLWAMGLNQSVIGVNKNLALINLSLLTGKIGKPGSGPFSLTGQPNAMGGREVGGLSNLLPAHREMQNPLHRKEVADYWKVEDIPSHPGLTATEMFASLKSGKMKAIWIICTNPLVSIPQVKVVEEALKKAEIVVVQDISYRSDTVKYADVVLPAAGWLEKEGTMTNSERRISYLPKVLDAPGEALPDIQILNRFAQKMGWGSSFHYPQEAADIYAEHVGLTRNTHLDISGLSHQRLREEGTFQWPVLSADSMGTARLFSDHQFYTPDKKARFFGVEDANLSEPTSESFPLILTTGRIRDQWHTMTKTGKVSKLNQHLPESFLEIHPLDAGSRNIHDGDLVCIRNTSNEVRVPAKVCPEIKKGVVFLPMHWGKILSGNFARANNITSSLVDPISKEPDFKFSAVQVEVFKKPKQKFLILGEGPGLSYFLKTFRKRNTVDEVEVFSSLGEVFYDPAVFFEFISSPDSTVPLVSRKNQEAEQLWDIQVHPNQQITRIDPKEKKIFNENGHGFSFDGLIILSLPGKKMVQDWDENLPGIFNLRHPEDAAHIKAYLKPGYHLMVAGGGEQGIQLALSLRLMLDQEVIILETGSRLVSGSLDEIGGAILEQKLRELGVQLIIGDTIERTEGIEKLSGIYLKSGQFIKLDMLVNLVFPGYDGEAWKNISGLHVQGIQVNEYFQTADPDIFAFGPIAEFKNQQFGDPFIWQQQADILSRFINGNSLLYFQAPPDLHQMKVDNLSFCSMGRIDLADHDSGYEIISFLDLHQQCYKKCVIHQDKLVGAILIGDDSEVEEFRELIYLGTELGEKRSQLLRANSKGMAGRKGKLVCTCKNIGEGNLLETLQSGCGSVSELSAITGAGTGCGSCLPEIKIFWELHRKSKGKIVS
ncbi:MAG: molybdopterin-dependent oxidoreductase [Chitinophagaceae bacterium]